MADWRETALTILLSDGAIDDREVNVIRKELFADGKIDRLELEFLLELRHKAQRVAASFNLLVLEALKNCLLGDGVIDPSEASLLRHWFLKDGKLDYGEKRFLQELKAGAKQTCPEFDELYQQSLSG